MEHVDGAAGLQPATDLPADIVLDVLQRVVARLADVPANVPIEVEAEIRRDWGGDRAYICKLGESGKEERTRREQAIRDDHRRGAHPAALARKWGMSIRRIQQIVKP